MLQKEREKESFLILGLSVKNCVDNLFALLKLNIEEADFRKFNQNGANFSTRSFQGRQRMSRSLEAPLSNFQIFEVLIVQEA